MTDYQIGMCSKVTIEFSDGQLVEITNPLVSLDLTVEEFHHTSIRGEQRRFTTNTDYEVSIVAVVSEEKKEEIDLQLLRLIREE